MIRLRVTAPQNIGGFQNVFNNCKDQELIINFISLNPRWQNKQQLIVDYLCTLNPNHLFTYRLIGHTELPKNDKWKTGNILWQIYFNHNFTDNYFKIKMVSPHN